MKIFTKEVVVAMNPLHSQRKERNVLRGSSGTIPDGVVVALDCRICK